MDPALSLERLKIPKILKEYGLSPKKGLGQNFLEDPNILYNIVEAAKIPAGHTVLEIGPGLGSLTRYLASSADFVSVVELDQQLIPILKNVLKDFDNVRITHADIMDCNPSELVDNRPYLVIANIPYYITSALIRLLLESRPRPQKLLITIQKEVSARICSKPGKLSILAVSVQVYGKPKQLFKIPAGAFYPAPKVDSSVLEIDLYDQPLVPEEQLDDFFKMVKAGFSQKRKTLRNSLRGTLQLSAEQTVELLNSVQIDPQRRAETLEINEWVNLSQAYLQNYKK
ncbi:MAG: ribosomal RNA small subunit methyltransferase A [Anaerolineaceae bacterium]|nr:ribosomal RNA small subunit methyltransferase A [Anaerolineaceae bacterium]